MSLVWPKYKLFAWRLFRFHCWIKEQVKFSPAWGWSSISRKWTVDRRVSTHENGNLVGGANTYGEVRSTASVTEQIRGRSIALWPLCHFLLLKVDVVYFSHTRFGRVEFLFFLAASVTSVSLTHCYFLSLNFDEPEVKVPLCSARTATDRLDLFFCFFLFPLKYLPLQRRSHKTRSGSNNEVSVQRISKVFTALHFKLQTPHMQTCTTVGPTGGVL